MKPCKVGAAVKNVVRLCLPGVRAGDEVYQSPTILLSRSAITMIRLAAAVALSLRSIRARIRLLSTLRPLLLPPPLILLGQASAPSKILRHHYESTRPARPCQWHPVRAHIRGITGFERPQALVVETWMWL